MIPPVESNSSRVERLYSQPVERVVANFQEIETQPCQVCGTCSASPDYTLTGTRFTTLRCIQCGLGSLFPRPTSGEIASFYSNSYYGSSGRKFEGVVESLVRFVGSRHARFLAKHVPTGGRILDVGCGRGITLQALAERKLEAHGFEVSSDAVVGVKAGVEIHVADSLTDVGFTNQFFDEVIIWHVLEHVPNPRDLLCEVHRILRPGGVVIVAVPNASSWQARWMGPAWFHLDPPRHLYHFPLSALECLLESTGFSCQSQHHFSLRQNPFGWIQSFANCISWLPRNGLYVLLHGIDQRDGRRSYSALTRLQLRLLLIVLAPAALLLSVVAALWRRGATVHVVAMRS